MKCKTRFPEQSAKRSFVVGAVCAAAIISTMVIMLPQVLASKHQNNAYQEEQVQSLSSVAESLDLYLASYDGSGDPALVAEIKKNLIRQGSLIGVLCAWDHSCDQERANAYMKALVQLNSALRQEGHAEQLKEAGSLLRDARGDFLAAFD